MKQTFETGAQRDSDEDKLRYDLIPPESMALLAQVLTDGAKHYGANNWRKGIPLQRTVSSLLRHVFAIQALLQKHGADLEIADKNGENVADHIGRAMANLVFLHITMLDITLKELPTDLEKWN